MESRRIIAAALVAAALVLASCGNTSSDDGGAEDPGGGRAPVAAIEESSGEMAAPVGEGEAIVASAVGTDVPADMKVIREGRVELRVDPATFEQASSRIRAIAVDLGGYLSSGETYLEEIDGVEYTVGWMTMRIPADRFDEALTMVDGVGERLSLSMSSQDVTEEYVDLESRLRYWKSQEDFYTRLMEEATGIDDLVTIQTRMEEVMLSIEQIEGQLRYLDDRTDLSTLTVSLTEIPDGNPGDVIGEAIDRAGTVAVATIAGLIVAGAFLLPFALLAGLGLLIWLAIRSVRRRRRRDRESAPSEE
jgi:hypothetical protein